MPLDLRNLSPVPGELNVDPETARFTKIGAVLEVEAGFVPMLFVKAGADPYTWHVVYDGLALAFSPMFDERSTVEIAGDIYTLELLPTGGWWASPLVFTFGQFQEAI